MDLNKQMPVVFMSVVALAVSFTAERIHANDVVISEIMAANDATLADEDGDYPDWVEFHNRGTTTVNLGGWYVTDSEEDLQKWRFPEVELAPKSFLTVFCSGKDRADPSLPLHTSFKLSADGEFLALLLPDGRTIVSQLSPGFPALPSDVSYGFPQDLTEFTILASGAEGRAFVPNDDALGIDWVNPDFDDSGWISGASGFGYDLRTDNTFAEFIGTDLSDLMFEKNATAYIRLPFVADPLTFDLLQLFIRYEDGFVAYLNGVEVARAKSPESLSWNSSSDGAQSSLAASRFQEFDLTAFKSVLASGLNLLAIHGLNNSATSRDFFILPELRGVSIGSLETDREQFFTVATPSAPNGTGFDGMAPLPQVSAPQGVYTESVTVELSSSLGELRFTLDGTEPTQHSDLYTAPIRLDRSRRLKARTFVEDFLPSGTLTRSYIILAPDVVEFDSNLPLVLVHTFGKGIDGGDLTPAYIHVIERGEDGRASILGAADFSGGGGIKERGKSTAGRVKASYALEIWDENNDDRDVEILGLPQESDWILYGPYNFDRALIRNALMYNLSNQVGRYAVRTRFVELFRRVGEGNLSASDYFGVYVFMEKIKRGRDRVNVEELLPEHTSEPEITGGYIVKIDIVDPGDTGFQSARGTPAGEGSFAFVYPKEADLTEEQFHWFVGHINEFEDVLYGPNFQDPDFGYAKYLDVLSFIDHHILNELTKNPDALRLSTYMFKPRQGRIQAGPIWDFDRTMGSDDDFRSSNPEGWYTNTNYEWWGEMARDPNYLEKYRLRWQELRDGPLRIQNIHSVIDSMAAELAEAQVRNFQKWTGLVTGDGWQTRIEDLKVWLADRVAWIDSQMIAPPEFSSEGGRVTFPVQLTITNPNARGDIVYTTNGEDPRSEDGGTNPNAIVYDGQPLTIMENTLFRARTRQGENSWSELAEASFFGNVPTLALTEIMYDPLEGGEFEFLELFNYGEEPVDLLGVSFVRGVSFEFNDPRFDVLQPGEYIVVVRNLEAFESRYAPAEAGIKVAGQYEGVLRDSGEIISLVGTVGETIFEFLYRSAWHPQSAGEGHSLVLLRPDSSPDTWEDPSSWRASQAVHGSPGKPDGGESQGGQVPGDSNQDGTLNVSDAIHLLSFLFKGGDFRLPCQSGSVSEAANVLLLDTNGDSSIDAADVVRNLTYLFLSGAPPHQGLDCRQIVGCPEVCEL